MEFDGISIECIQLQWVCNGILYLVNVVTTLQETFTLQKMAHSVQWFTYQILQFSMDALNYQRRYATKIWISMREHLNRQRLPLPTPNNGEERSRANVPFFRFWDDLEWIYDISYLDNLSLHSTCVQLQKSMGFPLGSDLQSWWMFHVCVSSLEANVNHGIISPSGCLIGVATISLANRHYFWWINHSQHLNISGQMTAISRKKACLKNAPSKTKS